MYHTLELSILPSQTEWDKSPIGMAALLNLSRGNLETTCERNFLPLEKKGSGFIVVGIIAFDQSAKSR